jgi:hypothetical protein
MLPLVQLNLTADGYKKMYLVDSSRLDYIRRDREDLDYLMMNSDWLISPTCFMRREEGYMIGVCRHHGQSHTQHRLYCHAPRKPNGNKLSAFRADQNSNVVLQPRVAVPVQRRAMNTVPTTFYSNHNYKGSDSANISIGGVFDCKGSRVMSRSHEILSMDRPDLVDLAKVMIREGIVMPELVEDWLNEYKSKYPPHIVLNLKRGSTYVPAINAVQLQMDASHGNRIRVLAQEVVGRGENSCVADVLLEVKQPWCGAIYNVQVEDVDNYGVRPKAIPKVDLNNKARTRLKNKPDELDERMSMLTWAMLGVVSGCKELYRAINKKTVHHSHKNFSVICFVKAL